MLYDIYNIKKSIIEYEKNLRKLSIRKRKTDISDIEISNLLFLYASLEYLKSVNSFIVSYELNLKNEQLNEEIKVFLKTKRDNLNNINIINKLTASFINKFISKNLSNKILSYFYLNDYLLPFKYSLRDFTILNIEECEFLEGINEVKIRGNLIIRLNEFLLELKKHNLLKISIHKNFLESFIIIKFKSYIPKLILPKLQEGFDYFFKSNGFSFLLKNKKKLKQVKIVKVSIKNNFVKIQFKEKMINKLLSLKNILFNIRK